ASSERWRCIALAGRRQKYSRSAAADMPATAVSICTSAPGWPSASVKAEAGASAPSSRARAKPRQTPHAASAAKVPPRTTTIATASSRAKPPSTAGRRPGGTLPGCAGSGAAPTSDIEVGHLQRVGLDELATRLDHVAHQGAED